MRRIEYNMVVHDEHDALGRGSVREAAMEAVHALDDLEATVLASSAHVRKRKALAWWDRQPPQVQEKAGVYIRIIRSMGGGEARVVDFLTVCRTRGLKTAAAMFKPRMKRGGNTSAKKARKRTKKTSRRHKR